MGSTLVRAITAFVRGGRSRRTLLRDSYLGVNFNDTRTWGCVMLAISAIGCSDRLLCGVLVGRGPTGATSRLGCREFCKADRGDRLAWCLRSNLKRLKLLNFGLIVRATEAVDRSDFSNVVWWPNRVYGYGLPVDMGMTVDADQGD